MINLIFTVLKREKQIKVTLRNFILVHSRKEKPTPIENEIPPVYYISLRDVY